MAGQFRESASRWGVGKAVFAWLMDLLQYRFGIHLAQLNIRPLSENPTIPTLMTGYSVRVLSNEDLVQAQAVAALDITREFIFQAQQRSDYCMGAYMEGDLVSYVWRGYKSNPISPRLTLGFSAPLRYGYKALTLPEHRGRQLLSNIALASDTIDCASGYQYALSYIATHNYASLISDEHRGNKSIGWMLWIDSRHAVWSFVSAGAKKRGISLVANK